MRNPLIILALCIPMLATAGPRSGYEFVKQSTRDLQDDDFENPGIFAVDRGDELFHQKHAGDKSCAGCHGEQGDAFDVKQIARYPRYDSSQDDIITLQSQVKACRERVSGDSLPTDHADLISLEAYVRQLARGEAVNVEVTGPVATRLKRGEELYRTRYGLIDLSCYHCHTLYPGAMIRGQKISEGQGNGFPAYRLDTGEVTSLSQRIKQCLSLMRAEPFPADSDEVKDMMLYIMSRSNGLPIETPAVRY